ncbi:MAG: putative rane protein [Acidimicrobiaceae bacterium]|nr:putative rane protein [Acidimicrobiaceae bacterium]
MRPAQARCFAAGSAALAIAVSPTFHRMADDSLTGHMAQHVILLTVVAPLLALGATVPGLLWGLPSSLRSRLHPLWQRAVRSAAGTGWSTWVAATVVIQAAVMWVWHAPVLYEAALHNDALHLVEHASFVMSSTTMWWALAGGRRSRRGAATIAVFVAAFPGTALGAGLLLAPRPWYPSYGSGDGGLHDQQLAGVVMWSFAGLIYVIAAVVLFGRWLATSDGSQPDRRHAPIESMGETV